MMSRSQYELRRFERDYFDTGGSLREIAIAPRRFAAMADVESMMWLQLGVELGMFDAKAAEDTFKQHEHKFLESLNYLEKVKKLKVFGTEAHILSGQVRAHEFPFAEHPNPFSAKLFVSGSIEMLFHEVGRSFREGVLTMCFVFASPKEFRQRLNGEPDPNTILRGENLRGIDLLLSKYLGFLEHAGAIQELWEYLHSVSRSDYAMSSLQQRVRAMHNWRLDLRTPKVRQRFDKVTGILVKELEADKQFQDLSLEAAELFRKIEDLCASWNGEDSHSTSGEGDREQAA
jgi:hypothetical protein